MCSIYYTETRHGFSHALTQTTIGRLRVHDPVLGEGKPEPLPDLINNMFKRPENRMQIDCYLLSFFHANNPLYILNRENTFCYSNMPDLIPYLTKAVIQKEFNQNPIHSFIGMFFLQNKNKSKHKSTLLSMVETKAILNTLPGLLLGLYPYNNAHGTFEQRSIIAGSLHEYLCQDSNELEMKNISLLSLSMFEYLNNVIYDFCPVEHKMVIINDTGRFVLNQLFDQFRNAVFQAMNTPGHNILCHEKGKSFLKLDIVNSIAQTVLPGIQRNMKMYHHKLQSSLQMTKTPVLDNEIIEKVMLNPIIPNCKTLALIKTLFNVSLHELNMIEYIWNYCAVYLLPHSYYERQLKIYQKYSASKFLQQRLTQVHFCLHCALSHKRPITQQKSSWDAINHTMYCHRCKRKQLFVNLMGRVLTIRNVSYVLCPLCLTPTIWGSECKTCVPDQRPPPNTCYICHNHHIVFTKMVVNVPCLRMDPVHLCAKHTKHTIRCERTIYDIDMLVKDATVKN